MNRELLGLVLVVVTALGGLILLKARTAPPTAPTTIADAWAACGGKTYANPKIRWTPVATAHAAPDLPEWSIVVASEQRVGIGPVLLCGVDGGVVHGFAHLVLESEGMVEASTSHGKPFQALENDVRLCLAVHRMDACDARALEVAR